MNKIYTLPDILPAPTSTLQGLVRRLIEYADFSVLPALVDHIKELGREREIRWLQGIIAEHLVTPNNARIYSGFVVKLLSIYWFDLFDVADTALAMQEKEFYNQQKQMFASSGSVYHSPFLNAYYASGDSQ